MSTRWLTTALLSVGLCVCADAAFASTPIFEFWKKLDFVTDSGNEVLVDLNKQSIDSIELTIKGKRVIFPRQAYSDLQAPVLNKLVLVSSSGIIDGHLETIYALEFPLADPAVDSQSWSDMHLVHFEIINGKLTERVIWDNQDRTKVVSRVQY